MVVELTVQVCLLVQDAPETYIKIVHEVFSQRLASSLVLKTLIPAGCQV